MPPVKMTRAEYETKYGSQPVVSSSTLDITPTPIRMTRAEYNAKYRPQAQTFGEDLSQDIKETGVAQQEALQTGVQRTADIDQRVASGETSKAKGLFQKFGTGLGTASNVLFQTVLGGAKAVLPQSVETKVSETLGADLAKLTAPETRAAFVNKLKESDGGLLVGPDLDQKAGTFLEEVGTAYRTDPDFQADVQAAGGILEWLALPGTARTALVKSADLAGDVVEDAGKVIRQTSDRLNVNRNDARVQSVVDELDAIENKYAPTRRKADLDPNVNESRTRIAQSNVLQNAVDEDGLIRTKTKGGAIDAYKNTPITADGKTLMDVEDVVKRNLENEGSKVNLNEVKADMYDAVTKSGLEGADLSRAIKGIDAELKGLSLRADEFGDVLLSKIQDAKTSIYKHIDYTKPAGVTYRKSLARVYKETIENKSDLPVKEWNGELAKYYKDLDRLADLDGKRVKGGRLGKYTAQLAGTALGGLGGSVGGAGGAIAGGIAGGELSSFLAGKSMAGTFKKGIKGDVPQNQILADAKARAEAGVKDLTKPDPQVGASKALLSDPDMPNSVKQQISKVEGQIKDNIKQQKTAIKAGDFTLVESLKEVYTVLVQRLKDIIADYKKNGIPLGMSIRKSVTPESVAKKSAPEDIKFLNAVIDDVKAAKADPDANNVLEAMGLGRATDDELVSFAKEVIDEADIAKNLEVKGSVPNNLVEEAKKYKSAEEFVKAQGTPVYHGSLNKIDEFTDSSIRPTFLTKDKKYADVYTYAKDGSSKRGSITEVSFNPEKILDTATDETARELYNNDFLKYIGGGEKLKAGEKIPFTTADDFYVFAKGQIRKGNIDYDAILVNEGKLGGDAFVPLDVSKIKTRTQLTDIWNKANETKT